MKERNSILLLILFLLFSFYVFSDETLWTTVYDGQTRYYFYVNGSASGIYNSPLDQENFGSVITSLTVKPQLTDTVKAWKLLQCAVNKVNFQHMDFSESEQDLLRWRDPYGYRATKVTDHVEDNNNNSFDLYYVGEKFNWGFPVSPVVMEDSSKGLYYYDFRVKLYKKILTNLIFDIEQSQIESFYSKHEGFFDSLNVLLDTKDFLPENKAEFVNQYIKHFFGKNYVEYINSKSIQASDVVSNYLSATLNVLEQIGNVSKDKKMMALIVAAQSLESYKKMSALMEMAIYIKNHNYNVNGFSVDPALVKAIEEEYEAFDKYYSGDPNDDSLYKEFIYTMVSNAQGTSDFRKKYVTTAEKFLAEKLFCAYTGPVAAVCAITYFALSKFITWTLEVLDYERGWVLASTLYKTIENVLVEKPHFVYGSDIDNMNVYCDLELLRIKSAYFAAECITQYTQMPGSSLYDNSEEIKAFYIRLENHISDVYNIRNSEWCLAGEKLPHDNGTADMRWLEQVYYPSQVSIDPPSDVQAAAVSTNEINVTWSYADPNIDGFKIHRKAGANGNEQTFIVGASERNFSDDNLSPGTTYYYKVCAYINDTENCSYEVNATTIESQEGISAYADPNPVDVNKSSKIEAIIKDANSQPVSSGIPVTFSSTSDVFFQSSGTSGSGSITVNTDSEGKAWTYMSCSSVGTVHITIESNGESTDLPVQVVDPYEGGEWTAEWTWLVDSQSSTEATYSCSILVKHNGEVLPLDFKAVFSANHGHFSKSEDYIGSSCRCFENEYTLTKSEADSGDEIITIDLYEKGVYVNSFTYVGNFSMGVVTSLTPFKTTNYGLVSDSYGTTIDVSDDGHYFAEVYGSYVRIWEIGNWGNQIHSYYIDNSGNCVNFSPDMSYIIAGDDRGYVYKISLTNGSKISRHIAARDIIDIDWYASNRIVMVSKGYDTDYPKVILCDQDLNVIWSKTLSNTVGDDDYVRVVGNANKGLIAVVKKGDYPMWYLLRASDGYELTSGTHDDYIMTVAFSDDGSKFYVGGLNGDNGMPLNKLYNVSYSGGTSISLSPTSSGNPQVSISDIGCACFFYDGVSKLAIGGNGKLEIFSANGGNVVQSSTNSLSDERNMILKFANGTKILCQSEEGSQAFYNFSSDTMSPGISIVPPSPLPYGSNSITLSGTVSDASGVVYVQYQVNGGSWQNATIDSSGTFTIPLPNLPVGDTIVLIKAFDYYNNETSQTIIVTRLPDMEAPIVSPGTVTPSHGSRGTTFTITTTIQDETGIGNATAIIKNQYGNVVANIAMNDDGNGNYSFDFATNEDTFGGMYTVDVVVVDTSPASNIKTYYSICNFTVDAYNLIIYGNQGGELSPIGITTYDAGETVTVTATPHEGYRFVGWQGDITSNSPTITLTINGDTILYGIFETTFVKHFGGTNNDIAYDMQYTYNGNYLLTGSSSSFTYGSRDFLIFKLNDIGNKLWRKHYGGTGDDVAYSISLCTDGGYIVAGASKSFSYGNYDFLIYKLDMEGNKLWRKNYGGELSDSAFAIHQTSDGGYIVAGASYSFSYGSRDFLIFKLDVNGNKVWRKHYGSTGDEKAYSIEETSDGGYIIAGYSTGFSYGGKDFLIMKLDASGNKIWRKHYGSANGDEIAYTVKETSDGCYIVAGSSTGFSNGGKDFLIFKLDANGNKIWCKNYGSINGDEEALSVKELYSGGYIVGGYSTGFSNGGKDFLIFKLDANGNKIWRKNYGSSNGDEIGYRVEECRDGGYAIVGSSTHISYGYSDFLIYKLNREGEQQ